MRFSPSEKFLLYARALAKTYAWRVFVRKVTDLGLPLDEGDWLNVSDRITDLPNIISRLEYEIGQFTSDSVELASGGTEAVTSNIEWWQSHVLNTLPGEYLEIKILFVLGCATDTCDDEAICFAGYIDQGRAGVPFVEKDEANDSVSFSCYTLQDFAGRLAGENLTGQYINPNIDGEGTSGIVLPLQSLFVKDANVAGYPLQPGTHTISLKLSEDGITPNASLDGGLPVNIANGFITLGNDPERAIYDTQRIVLYTPQAATVPNSGEASVVVTAQGDILPRQWLRYFTAKRMLTRILDRMGARVAHMDDFEIPTATGEMKVSFVDSIPGDDSFVGRTWALVAEGNDLWIGVENRLYKRDMAEGTTSYVTAISDSHIICKLFYDERNKHIWGVAQSDPEGDDGGPAWVFRYDIGLQTLSAEVPLIGAKRNTVELIDFVYFDVPLKYAIVYVDFNAGDVRQVDGTTLVESLVFSTADLGYVRPNGIDGHLSYKPSEDKYRFTVRVSPTARGIHEIGVAKEPNGHMPGDWANVGRINSNAPRPFDVCAYHVGEGRIYYLDVASHSIKSFLETGGASSTVLALPEGDAGPWIMQYKGTHVYFTTTVGRVYSCATSIATLLSEPSRIVPIIISRYFALEYIDRLYGVDDLQGRLYQCHSTVQFVIPEGRFDGLSIQGAWNKCLQAFNLIGTITSNKTGLIFKRGTYDGIPRTSGEILEISIDDASQIVARDDSYGAAFELVEVSNGKMTASYNGQDFNATVLTDARKLQITNDLIPNEIVEDVCYYAYQFFKTHRSLITIDLGNIPLFQFEPFDGCTIRFNTTRIRKVAENKPIYATTLTKTGSMQIQVLV